MTRITPSQFKDAFLKVVSSDDSVKSRIYNMWDEKKDYTALMLDVIFCAIAKELCIEVWNGNYYYLDSIFYAERDENHFGPVATYAKCISIAMEHEHDIRGTAVEMNKLQLFNAPLKVLITYPLDESRRNYYLDVYNKILQDADIFEDFATLRRQLVIFGTISGEQVVWRFYAYEATGLQKI